MENPKKYDPPRIPMFILRRCLSQELREDIEGDLLERFNNRVESVGILKARRLFIKDIIQLFSSGWILHQLYQNTLYYMKRANWINLVLINSLLVLLIIAPFLPGPAIKPLIGLSMFGQATGLIGLLLVPVALVWIVYEIRKTKLANGKTLNWRIPYWLSVVSLLIVALALTFLTIAISFQEGVISAIIVFLVFVAVLISAVRGISRLKIKGERKFNTTPVYLLTIPVIAFLTNLFVVKPLSNYSMNVAIQRSHELITSIESYKLKEGKYPESIDDLKGVYFKNVPGPRIMGITKFRYNKIDENYSLSFSQWLEWGSLEVIVLYDKNNLRNNLKGRYAEWDYSFDLCRTKGAFASYDTKFENWRYYLCD